MHGTQSSDGFTDISLTPRPPSWRVIHDIDGRAELVLHVFEDSLETWMSFRLSQGVH